MPDFTDFLPRPDLGSIKILPSLSGAEDYDVNLAGVVELARTAGTPAANRFYAAFVKAWAGWKNRPIADTEKQKGAMQEAFAEIGKKLEFHSREDRSDV